MHIAHLLVRANPIAMLAILTCIAASPFFTTKPSLAHRIVSEDAQAVAASKPDWAQRRRFLTDIRRRNLNRLTVRENFVRKLAELRARGLSRREIARRLFRGPSAAFPSGTGPLSPLGDRRILTILIDFPDVTAAHHHPGLTVERVRAGILGSGGPSAAASMPFDSVRNYYSRASQGKLSLGGEVHNWVRMDKNREDYKPVYLPGEHELVSDQKALLKIFIEAMQKIDATVDFGDFDNDNDGDIDGIVILYAGAPEGWGDFFWAYRWNFWINEAATTAAMFDGKRIDQFVFQFIDQRPNGDFDMKTLIHEAGHLLGLNDYYDYCTTSDHGQGFCSDTVTDPGPDGGVGKMDMMDGNWGNHNAYSRWLLDWISPKVIGSGTHTVTLRASGEAASGASGSGTHDAVAVFPTLNPASDSNAPAQEMFIIEYRNKTGNDAQIPGTGGIVIWHLAAKSTDAPLDTDFDNSFSRPKQLKFMRAGSVNDFGSTDRVRSSDFFVAGHEFGPNTIPNSNSHSGIVTGVRIKDLQITGQTASLTIEVDGAQPVVAAAPPPAGTPVPNATTSSSPESFDLESVMKQEAELNDLAPAELAKRWNKAQENLSANPTLEQEIRARTVFSKWLQKDPSGALEALSNSAAGAKATVSNIIKTSLTSLVKNNPRLAGDSYFKPSGSKLRAQVKATGSLDFLREVFSARAQDGTEKLTKELDQIEGLEELFSAVRGLKRAGQTDLDLKGLSNKLRTKKDQYDQALQLDTLLDQWGKDAKSPKLLESLSDDVMQLMKRRLQN